jgi:resuscitation-promoting factor RpfB
MSRQALAFIALIILILSAAGCQTESEPVFVEVDNSRRAVPTDAVTVRDALQAVGVTLGPLDRVVPDLYVETEPGMVIAVTRVEEVFETEQKSVPFQRKTVTNEALPAGETRLVQLGVDGVDEITYRLVIEDGREVERSQIQRVPISPTVDEIIAVGPTGDLPPTPLAGTIAYISSGNGWVMRETSGGRRPVTTAGDLDGRVFDLSPDGRVLLFTRRLDGSIETPINQLWVVNTTIVGEKPISLPVQGVLYGEWSDDGTHIAYSTAERTTSPPGWQANNDLWLISATPSQLMNADTTISQTMIISANTSGLYSWWGTTYVWSPTGRHFAFARPSEIGVIDVISNSTTILSEFPPFNTYSEWVWIPSIGWSQDGEYIAAVVHGAPAAEEKPQDSQVFDLWVFRADGSISARLVDRVGMWSVPIYGNSGILYGRAQNPLQSLDSRYYLEYRDRDGSNPRTLFPLAGEAGIEPPPQIALSPTGREFVFIYNGNLYFDDRRSPAPRQLTTDNQNSQPCWEGLPR